MICAIFSLLKFYVFIAFWTIVCVFNGNCLKSYRTVGDFRFLAEIEVSVLMAKQCLFVLEKKKKKRWNFFHYYTGKNVSYFPGEKSNERKKDDTILNKRCKTLFTPLEVVSHSTLAILIQNRDVVKSETPFRLSTTLHWAFVQHAD